VSAANLKIKLVEVNLHYQYVDEYDQYGGEYHFTHSSFGDCSEWTEVTNEEYEALKKHIARKSKSIRDGEFRQTYMIIQAEPPPLKDMIKEAVNAERDEQRKEAARQKAYKDAEAKRLATRLAKKKIKEAKSIAQLEAELAKLKGESNEG
jgi:hypothetical protein